MQPSRRKELIEQEAYKIQRFVSYLQDASVRSQLLEVVARALPASGDIPRDILDQALNAVVGYPDDEFYVGRVVSGAPAFEQLVRYAKKLDADVLPRRFVPGQAVVTACLEEFHAQHKPRFKYSSVILAKR